MGRDGPARALHRHGARRRHRRAGGGLLGGLRDLGSPLLAAIRYRPVEVEPARLEALRDRLAADGPRWTPGRRTPPAAGGARRRGRQRGARRAPGPPRHRPAGRPPRAPGDHDGRRRLRLAGERSPRPGASAARLARRGRRRSPTARSPRSASASTPGCRRRPAHLAGGLVVLVDYALEPAELHGPDRPDGTLRTFAAPRGRRATRSGTSAARTSPRPWTWPRSGPPPAAPGLDPVGETTRAELLARAGTPDLTDAQLRRPGAGDQRCPRAAIGARPPARPAGHGRVPGAGVRARPAGRAPGSAPWSGSSGQADDPPAVTRRPGPQAPPASGRTAAAVIHQRVRAAAARARPDRVSSPACAARMAAPCRVPRRTGSTASKHLDRGPDGRHRPPSTSRTT